MPTSSQILAALSISNTFEILNLTAPYNTGEFTDNTDWAAIGISTGAGDTVKIISKVLNPVSIAVHENAGYAAGDYTSPDTTLASLTASPFTLLNLTGTTSPVPGVYIFYLKCQVTPFGASAIVVEKSFSIELNQNLLPSLSLSESYNCSNATYTSTDDTDYATAATQQGYSITNITRVHVTQPPLNSLRSNGSTPQTSISANAQTNYLAASNNPLWTGTYQSSIQSDVTYRKDGNYTLVHVPVFTKSTTVACDEDLCNLFCCLKGLISNYNTYREAGNSARSQEYLAKWDAGNRYIVAIREAKACNNAELQASYTALFYTVTGCDPNCDCGCTDGPAPVIPTVSTNGTDGTDGSQILDGTTVPDNSAGNVGDYYIRTTNGFFYKKTGPSAWTYLFTLIGATGATGATGAAGVSVLYNSVSDSATAGTAGFETLKTYTLLANQMGTDGDVIHIRMRFKPTTEGGLCRGFFDATTALGGNVLAGGVTRIELDSYITRTSSTEAKFESILHINTDHSTGIFTQSSRLLLAITTIGAMDWTTTTLIEAQGNSSVIGDVVCELMQITYYHKS